MVIVGAGPEDAFWPTGSGKTLAQRSGCRLADLASNCRRASAFSSDLASARRGQSWPSAIGLSTSAPEPLLSGGWIACRFAASCWRATISAPHSTACRPLLRPIAPDVRGFGQSAQPPREASSTLRQPGEDDDRLSRYAIYAINLLLVAVASMIPPYGRARG